MKAYYDRRAPEYDEWYLGLGRFDGLERPHWNDDLRALERTVAALPPARTLDVACGTGFLTRHLRGEIVGLDQSAGMLAIARDRIPAASFVEADALTGLPFPDASFDRVFTGHFYGHLEPDVRARFLADARRLAREVVVVDAAVRPDCERKAPTGRRRPSGARALPVLRLKRPVERLAHSETSFEERQERVLNDGSRWTVYKRYFTGEELARELGGAEVSHESRWFVVVRSTE